MATTTAFNSLLAPAADDSMEMSSPANRNLDDDIDIDFDDYPAGGVHVADDEQMIEDSEPARPATGTDDMMEDDILPGEQALADEEIMQHDGVQVQEMPPEEDEELIDYGDDEVPDPAVEDTLIPTEIEEPAQVTETPDNQDDEGEDTASLPGIAIPTVPPRELVEESEAEIVQFPDPQIVPEELLDPSASGDLKDRVHAEPDGAFADELRAFESAEQDIFGSQNHLQADVDAAQPPISVNTALSAQTDTPGTPTDTGLHPMNIRYGDLRMPLFKSRRQPDGLLKDDNLASLSLAELIRNCRQRLAIKIGEDISEDQELVLGFDHLGMILVEDSRAAFESSLNDILDVYLQLHRNDANPDIPPLSLTLSLQLKFASSFALFKNAAAGGQGMSAFGFLQPAGEEEFYPEEYEDEEGAALYGDDGEQAAKTNQQHLPGDHHGFDSGEDPEGYHPQDHYEDQEDYHDDASKETYVDFQDQAPPGFEELLQGEHHLTDSINNALDDTAAAGHDVVSDGKTLQLDAALGQAKEVESRESSTTVQDDHVNTNAAYTSSGHDDFSTFLTEFEAEEEAALLPKDDQGNIVKDTTAKQDPGLGEGEHKDHTFVDQHLGSEDFLNDLGENEHEGQDHHDGEHDTEEHYEPGEGDEQYGEDEYYDQADTYGEQQDEEYHPDYQPGEDDEQFHTAQQDFLQGDYYEHRPEHDVHNDDDEGLDDTVNTVVHYPVEEYEEGETQEDFEDDLRFDDETFEHQDDQGKASKHTASEASLSNKRSFDDLADEDDLDVDERDAKKSRAS